MNRLFRLLLLALLGIVTTTPTCIAAAGIPVYGYKIVNTLGLTHPLHTVRAAELQQWIASGDYERILRGEYTRRGKEAHERPLKDDIGAAGGYYAQEARDTVSQVVSAAKKAAEKVGEAFRKGQSE